jgi:hypothetical protein
MIMLTPALITLTFAHPINNEYFVEQKPFHHAHACRARSTLVVCLRKAIRALNEVITRIRYLQESSDIGR